MAVQEYYTIGEVSKICNISTKALRYYDKIGIVSPDYIREESGYRYYSRETLLKVPVLKYYKQMGFKLEEMQEMLDGNSYSFIQQSFHSKIEELQMKEQEIRSSLISIRDWYDLIREAQLVVRNRLCDVSAKYISGSSFCYMDQEWQENPMAAVINIPWTNYLEEAEEQITGPVVLSFSSFKEKYQGACKTMRIMQRAVIPDEKSRHQIHMKGGMAVCVYHIGSHETINQEYERILQWAKARGITCSKRSYERYVVDYWTTRNPEEFVTEIIVPFGESFP